MTNETAELLRKELAEHGIELVANGREILKSLEVVE